ncbi:hypothetical protein FGE05_06375 [Pseudomonas sp. ICMP22404]|uniref:hypothetical protein n=1 Tax=Pseudomonas sp. ICMP22404 TaxID=2583807 RepID=UPI0011188CFD|nr:hypothetical protein [Pseudomonas sp. ICMP22404]TNF83827.1 hypothetical protein FGE05_06375 [Pseudomonas sp. ICMP22404]
MEGVIRTLATGCVVAISLCVGQSNAAGEKYQEQGRILGGILISVLIKEGACANSQECFKKELIFGDDDTAVRINFYDMQDTRLINALISEAILFGSQLEHKVPVKLTFNSRRKAELMGLRFWWEKSDISVEIN